MGLKRQLDRRTVKGKLEASEKHVKHGKELVMRITHKMREYEEVIRMYETRVEMAGTYIGLLAEIAGVTIIGKDVIGEFLRCKAVKMEASEDGNSVNIIVTEVSKDADKCEISENGDNQDETKTAESTESLH